MTENDPLTYFPTFEEWVILKRQVDTIEPMRLIPVKSVDSPYPLNPGQLLGGWQQPQQVVPSQAFDWQRMLYDQNADYERRSAEIRAQYEAQKRKLDGEAKNGEDFWNQISGG